jgi:hypothetical protein
MDQVSPVPDTALFHVDLQKAFALIPWGNGRQRRSSGSETMKDSSRLHAASTSLGRRYCMRLPKHSGEELSPAEVRCARHEPSELLEQVPTTDQRASRQTFPCSLSTVYSTLVQTKQCLRQCTHASPSNRLPILGLATRCVCGERIVHTNAIARLVTTAPPLGW